MRVKAKQSSSVQQNTEKFYPSVFSFCHLSAF